MTAVYLFGGILVVLLAAVILAALTEERRTASQARGAGSAWARKEAAIEALRELEFDFQTGKIEDEDYQALRRRWARQAIEARDELGEPTASVEGRCPTCGSDTKPAARFCSRCGSPLTPTGGGANLDA